MIAKAQSTNASRYATSVDVSTMYAIFLFFNFMVTFRVLLISLVPALELIMEVLYEGVILLYIAYRVANRIIIKDYWFNSFEIYLMIMFLLPVWAANAARLEFGQPMFYGVASMRDFYLIFGALIVYNMLRTKRVDILLVERMFLVTAWTNIIMFYTMTLFTNPKQFQDTGLAGANDAKGGDVYYRFNMAFVFFGSIYYFLKAFFERKPKFIIHALLFLAYIVLLRFDRTSIAVAVGAIAMLYITAITPRVQLLYILGGFLPIALISVTLLIYNPGIYKQYYIMFADAFSTLGGAANAEGEESVRLAELRLALDYTEKNPLIGNGQVSKQWKEGGYSYFMDYFYASDVGVFGQIFMYGYVGAFFLYLQFILAFIYSMRIKHIKRNKFLVAIKFFMIALALDSITNGYLTIYAAQSITGLMLIRYFYEQDRLIGEQLKVEKIAEVRERKQLLHQTRALEE